MHFGSLNLHPSSILIAWLVAILSLQFAGYSALGLLGFGLLLSVPAIALSSLDYIRRARWLLLMLWLVLAYNTPGEAFEGMVWAPTYEGLAEANLHTVRLVMMLVCLAWLFRRLGRDGLLSAIWGLLLPLRWLGFDVQRLLVRLSLVLENLHSPPTKGAWKLLLVEQPDFSQGPAVLRLSQPVWRSLDSLVVACVSLFFMVVISQ